MFLGPNVFSRPRRLCPVSGEGTFASRGAPHPGPLPAGEGAGTLPSTTYGAGKSMFLGPNVFSRPGRLCHMSEGGDIRQSGGPSPRPSPGGRGSGYLAEHNLWGGKIRVPRTERFQQAAPALPHERGGDIRQSGGPSPQPSPGGRGSGPFAERKATFWRTDLAGSCSLVQMCARYFKSNHFLSFFITRGGRFRHLSVFRKSFRHKGESLRKMPIPRIKKPCETSSPRISGRRAPTFTMLPVVDDGTALTNPRRARGDRLDGLAYASGWYRSSKSRKRSQRGRGGRNCVTRCGNLTSN